MFEATIAAFAICAVWLSISRYRYGWSAVLSVHAAGGTFVVGNDRRKVAKPWGQIFALSIVCALIIGTVAIQPGTDAYAYLLKYQRTPTHFLEAFRDKDPGYTLLMACARNFGLSYQTFRFLLSALISFLYISFIFKYSINPLFSLLLFFFMGFFSQETNAIRQLLAAGFTILGVDSVVDKRFWRYVLLCLIASLFHFSALICIPLYFLFRSNPYSSRSILRIVLFIFLFIFFIDIVAWIAPSLTHILYAQYLSLILEKPQGTNSLRIIVNTLPAILAFLLHRRNDQVDLYEHILVNGAIVNAGIFIFSSYHVYIARLAFYVQPFNILLIPYLLNKFESNSRHLLIFIVVICYIVFYAIDTLSL